MNSPLSSPLGSRLLAGVGTLMLLAAVGLFASRPAHTAGGPVPVNVANAVQDRDSPARQPFQARLEIRIENGNTRGTHDGDYTLQGVTVPAGKRLIVQTLTHFRYRTGLPAPADDPERPDRGRRHGQRGRRVLPPAAGVRDRRRLPGRDSAGLVFRRRRAVAGLQLLPQRLARAGDRDRDGLRLFGGRAVGDAGDAPWGSATG